eukprot:SAG31_NODE_762_length_12275_cov_14.077119_9_plen_710_part_00
MVETARPWACARRAAAARTAARCSQPTPMTCQSVRRSAMRHAVIVFVVRLGSVLPAAASEPPIEPTGAAVTAAAEEAEAAVWQNLTVYRITPITDKGVANMNTADAAGDVYFGLSQLLLPYMCTGATSACSWHFARGVPIELSAIPHCQCRARRQATTSTCRCGATTASGSRAGQRGWCTASSSSRRSGLLGATRRATRTREYGASRSYCFPDCMCPALDTGKLHVRLYCFPVSSAGKQYNRTTRECGASRSLRCTVPNSLGTVRRDTGVFSCGMHGGGSSGWPAVCDGYDEHHSHYLAGTPIGAPIPLPQNGSVAACCAMCSSLQACDGWVLKNSTAQKPECVLLSNGTLKDNPDGIVSAQRDRGQHEYCWYDDNFTYSTWKDFCSMRDCSCDAMNKLSLGLEVRGVTFSRLCATTREIRDFNREIYGTDRESVCVDRTTPCAGTTAPRTIGKGLLSRLCATIREIRDFNREIHGTDRESVCINRTLRVTNRTYWWNFTGADCDPGVEEGDCDSSTPAGVAACKKKCLDDPYCGGFNSDNHLKYADCVENVQQSSSITLWVLKDAPQPAGLSALVSAPPQPPDYDTWMRDLACLMDGNWYSSQAAGQCKDEADTDCWWRLASPENGERVVNASCVDDRVQSSLRQKNEACWNACAQPDNATALCAVSCLFETMIGDPTTGRAALTKEEVVAPFEAAFDEPSQGGCASP